MPDIQREFSAGPVDKHLFHTEMHLSEKLDKAKGVHDKKFSIDTS